MSMTREAIVLLIKTHITDFMLNHESDIANDVNDFGDLKLAFCYYLDRQPKQNLTVEAGVNK